MLLHEPFAAVAARLPEKIAVVGKDERLTYGQLQQRVHALARVLRDDGVQPGDRVVVLLENDVSFAVALQAVLAVAAVFVPVSPLAKADKVTFIVDDTRAAALVTADTLAATWQPVLERARSLLACRVTGHLRAPPHDPRVRAWPHDASAPLPVPDPSGGDEDLALVVYTSGSTG